MTRRGTTLTVLLLVTALAAACGGQDDDPEGAKALWAKINTAPGFTSWTRAPNYGTRTPSFTVHGRSVDIYVSPEVAGALGSPTAVTSWPVGSIIVKDSYSGGGDRTLVAVMEKRADGWFWAEYDADGGSLFSGKPKICVDCHDNRAAYSDWVYSFEFSR